MLISSHPHFGKGAMTSLTTMNVLHTVWNLLHSLSKYLTQPPDMILNFLIHSQTWIVLSCILEMLCFTCANGENFPCPHTYVHKHRAMKSMKLVILLHFISWKKKRLQTMLWHHNARVNSHQRWKQMRFRICFHL